ncbi:hypothetical protein ACGFR8_08190 [Streptomyces brevispora]|uniref:hypothetical protein n=1 Tax=Streptomyces brevispora TaxID=887462 RepID=UPI003716EFA3
MKTVRLDNALLVGRTIPNPSLVCLIGAAGSDKSTWASTWHDTQVLELDQFRTMVSDDFSVKFNVLSGARRPVPC